MPIRGTATHCPSGHLRIEFEHVDRSGRRRCRMCQRDQKKKSDSLKNENVPKATLERRDWKHLEKMSGYNERARREIEFLQSRQYGRPN